MGQLSEGRASCELQNLYQWFSTTSVSDPIIVLKIIEGPKEYLCVLSISIFTLLELKQKF